MAENSAGGTLRSYSVSETSVYHSDLFGKTWVKEKKIGNGHFGEVFLGSMDLPGRDEKLKIAAKKVPMKVTECGDGKKKVTRLVEEEIKILESMSNQDPNIVSYIGCTYKLDAGYMYLLTEFIDGPTLNKYVESFDNGLAEPEIRMITKQCLNGLKFLHEKKIVHKDIKPDNIMIRKGHDKIIKIIDFGLACVDGKFSRRSEIAKLWAAPEVSLKPNEKCDSFSLGLTVYFMATKQHPLEDLVKQNEGTKALQKMASLKEELPELPVIKYSENLRNFYRNSTLKDVMKRKTCTNLLQHDFITKGGEKSLDVEHIDEAWDILVATINSLNDTNASNSSADNNDNSSNSSTDNNDNSSNLATRQYSRTPTGSGYSVVGMTELLTCALDLQEFYRRVNLPLSDFYDD